MIKPETYGDITIAFQETIAITVDNLVYKKHSYQIYLVYLTIFSINYSDFSLYISCSIPNSQFRTSLRN